VASISAVEGTWEEDRSTGGDAMTLHSFRCNCIVEEREYYLLLAYCAV